MGDNRDQAPAPKFVAAVANAVSILRAIAQAREPIGVAAIARATNVSVSTCHNILRTLANERLVEMDPDAKTYSVGLGVLEFSAPLLGANQADLIWPELQRLASMHRSLVCLWQVTDEERVVLVDCVSSGKTVRVDMPDGTRLPAFAGAVGRCYAALGDFGPEEIKTRFDRLEWQNPPKFEDYLADVEQARRDGYAFDYGRLYVGLEIAAAMITDSAGRARFGVSGINIAGQLEEGGLQRLAQDLRDSADWISETLFGVAKGTREAERRLMAPRPAPAPRR